MEAVRLNVQPEGCCDESADIIHNHFDCPACGTKAVEANEYHDITDPDYTEDGFYRISCEKCGARYKFKMGQVKWRSDVYLMGGWVKCNRRAAVSRFPHDDLLRKIGFKPTPGKDIVVAEDEVYELRLQARLRAIEARLDRLEKRREP